MRIYIIRHADPNYDNDALTSVGHREAVALAEKLADFTTGSGNFILRLRSGFKDIHNVVTEEPLPHGISALLQSDLMKTMKKWRR